MDSVGKRLIELSLPLKAISAQSAWEKSIRHGHISTLHIWWARRPLAAMRAAIFASLVQAPETYKEREELEKLIEIIVNWDQARNDDRAPPPRPPLPPPAKDLVWEGQVLSQSRESNSQGEPFASSRVRCR
jgi:adenine-specific DNA methylase